MFARITQILAMIRFSHTVFALPFALLAAVTAWTTTDFRGRAVPFRWQHLLGIVVCMVAARSAAMAFNRLVDRRIDAENPRTQMRHLPAGLLSTGSVAAFTLACSAVFVMGTLLFLPNPLPIILSLPVLLFLFAYSYTKRVTSLAHFWLGAALMLSPICAWIAIRGEVVLDHPADILPPLILGTAVLLWVSGFDMIYACQDAEFDAQAQLHSIPARIGVAAALRLAAACHLLMIVALIGLPLVHALGGPRLDLGWIYWTAVLLVAALLAYEHWLVRPDDLTRVNLAFFHVNAIVSIGLFLVTSVDLLI